MGFGGPLRRLPHHPWDFFSSPELTSVNFMVIFPLSLLLFPQRRVLLALKLRAKE